MSVLVQAKTNIFSVLRQPAFELKGHTGAVVGAAWLSSGNMLATASWDHNVRLWSVESPDRPVSVISAGIFRFYYYSVVIANSRFRPR